jgi:hypothetical protein
VQSLRERLPGWVSDALARVQDGHDRQNTDTIFRRLASGNSALTASRHSHARCNMGGWPSLACSVR